MTVSLSKLLVTSGIVSLLAAAPASAATTTPIAYSPWAALAAFGSPSSSQAPCGAAAASAAGTAVQGASGCVFPTLGAPAPPPVAQAAPIGTPAAVATGGGVGFLPLLVGLTALGGFAALLLANGDDAGTQISISV